MQAELAAEHPDLAISLLVVNEAGYDSGLDDLYEVTALPVMQDDDVALVWDQWDATWRDTWVLDDSNAPVGVFNLTEHDLSDPDEYQTLFDMLVAAAGG